MELGVLSDVNWLGVLLATVAYFAVGGLWYAPALFGRAWMRAAGMAEPAAGEGPGPGIYVVPLVSALIASAAFAMLARAMNASGFVNGLELGLVVGVGFGVTLLLTTATFDTHKPQPWVWFAITAGYHVVGLVVAAIVVSVVN